MRKFYALIAFLSVFNCLSAQTPVPMASQPGLTYTENFSDIVNWTNAFAAGIGANRFGSVPINALGVIPDGVRITTSTATFVTGTSGGVQRGSSQTPSLQSIVLLSTGTSDNTTSAAIDFFMDFTSVNVGTLSFDWASLNNSTGDRRGSLRVYYSVDGTAFTEIVAAQVLNFINNVSSSGSITSVSLPAAFNNSPTARLRFYYHNGTGGATGSRPKISIDNLTVTASAGNNVSVAAGVNAAESGTTGSFTINFSSPTTISTDVDFTYSGSASFGTDYSVSYTPGSTTSTTNTGTLSVPAGTSSVMVTITPLDDGAVEGTENISLTLSGPTAGYSLGSASASINLLDNDVPPTVSVAAGVNAAEPLTNGTFIINLSAPAPSGGVNIIYSLSGTATQGPDYNDPQSGTLAIAEGLSSGTITLTVNNDPDAEPVETIIITLNSVSAPYVINTGSATINLTSDDISPISLGLAVYSQLFNALTNTGTTNQLNIPGWLMNETGGGARDNELYAADNGGSNTGDTYSYGVTATTDRALGSLQSGTLISSYGSWYVNNTGSTITKLRVTYTGEQWRLGATGRNDRLDFQYSVDATNLTTGTWTDVDALDFIAPNNSGSVGALDGNAAANSMFITFDITGLSIPNGSGFFIRWNDFNATGADDGLAIDELFVEANPVDLTPPVIISLNPANGSTNVPLNFSATINFNEPIQKGSGNIILRYASDGSAFQTIDVNSGLVSISSSIVSISFSGLTVNTGYYVEFGSGVFEDESGNDFAGISGSATWAFTTGINFYVAAFNGCTSGLTDGFTQYSITGSIVWGCTTFGRDPAAPAGSAPFPYGVQINGFAGGTNVPNIDWLISPSLDLTGTTFPLLSFWSRTAFNGLPLQLRVSTDYVSGDPSLATWTVLNGKFPAQTSNIWTLSSDINLSAFKQSNVHIAFIYTSTDDDGARWTLDDITIINSPTPPPPSLTVGTTDIQFPYVAAGSSADKSFVFTGNDLTDDITLNSTGVFLLSKDGISFSTSLLYTIAEANNIPTTVYVRFSPTLNGQDYAGTINVATGSLSASITLKGTSIDPATTLEVVNWNVEWLGSDEFGPTNNNQQEQNVLTIMQNIGADIFALVEVVDEARLANIVSQMPGYSYVISNYGSHTNTTVNPPSALAEAQKLAYVYKTNMFSNVTTTALVSQGINSAADLSNPAYNYWASGRFPYMMTADVTLNCVTKQVRFILVHGKANTSPTTTSYNRRKAGADTLHYTLSQLYPNDNIIILGDFNDDLDQSITAGFTTTSWDAFTTDGVNFEPVTLPLSLAGKKSTVSYNDVIDHVVVSNDFESYYMNSTANILNDVTSLVSNYGSTTTDHYPVFSRYRFENPPAPEITCPGNINQGNDAGTCGAVINYDVSYVSHCGEGTFQQTAGLPSGSVFPIGVTTNTFVITDATGNTATCSFTVTISDNTNPAIVCPVNVVKSNDPGICGSIVNYAVSFSDNCPGATILQTEGLESGSVFPTGTTSNTFIVTDASGNTATCSFTVTVIDNEAPVFTRPADKIIGFTGTCTYNAAVVITGDVTNESDNCSAGLQATFTDQVAQCGNNLIITRTWHLSDGNGNQAAPQVQTITITDNNTSYIVYATKEAKFGEYNSINGSVGVTSFFGKAEFKRGTVLPSPYFARALRIEVSNGATVPNRIYSPANNGPNPPFFSYSGNTNGLPNYTVSTSTLTPVSGNYRELRIKKNVSVTVTGTLYGKIEIEEGAQVTFTPVSGIINIGELEIDGKKNAVTRIKFGNCTSVRVKDEVDIDEYTEVNVNGPKVIFYVGNTFDDGEFSIKGGNTILTANVYIKKGELKVEGDNNKLTTLNGWYIAEKVESEGRNVVWNSYTCSPVNLLRTVTSTAKNAAVVKGADQLTVKVSPNPGRDQFTIQIESNRSELISVRYTDLSGRVIGVQTGVSANTTIKAGRDWINGVYFGEIIQGNERRVVKLVKIN